MQGQYAVGVILSGTGSDGTLGIVEIKSVGGVTFAQDDRSAQHAGMPQHAVASGAVDLVLPPQRNRRTAGGAAPGTVSNPGIERPGRHLATASSSSG